MTSPPCFLVDLRNEDFLAGQTARTASQRDALLKELRSVLDDMGLQMSGERYERIAAVLKTVERTNAVKGSAAS